MGLILSPGQVVNAIASVSMSNSIAIEIGQDVPLIAYILIK
ncbi:MAG: hypothetical protein WA949_13840 [Phormidesmis sp.]